MLDFKDFVPTRLQKGSVFKNEKFEELTTTLEKANAWIKEHSNYQIINVETVLLPNIHSSLEEGSADPKLQTIGEYAQNWYQIIRVWYRQ